METKVTRHSPKPAHTLSCAMRELGKMLALFGGGIMIVGFFRR
jgi:hypothetical protein